MDNPKEAVSVGNDMLTAVSVLSAIFGGIILKLLEFVLKMIKPGDKDDKRIAALEQRVTEISNNCSQCSRGMQDGKLQAERDLNSKLESVYTRINSISDAARKETEQKIEMFQRELSAVRAELSAIRSNITGNEKDIARVNGALEKLDSLIREVEAQVNKTLGLIKSWEEE